MKFNPPKIDHINDVLPFVADNPAFIVANKGWYTVIDYRYMHDDMFNNSIERECRGIKFNTNTGFIIGRPYHKFHNLNERPAYSTENVNLENPHVILDKLDGSMVHTCPSDLGIYLMTRMGDTDVAKMADKVLQRNPVKFSNLFNALPVDEYTHIFEYVGPNNRIVLNYAEEELILTAIRHNRNGTYVFHDELEKIGSSFGIKVVQKFPFDGFDNKIERIAENIKSQTNTEGYVVRFDTGEMIKIKADEYVRKHRSKELIASQKGVLDLITSNTLDDVLPQLDPETTVKAVKYNAEILSKISTMETKLYDILKLTKHFEQKEYALFVQANLPKVWWSAAFNVRKGDPINEAVVNVVRNNIKTNKDAVAFLKACDWPVWEFSFFDE